MWCVHLRRYALAQNKTPKISVTTTQKRLFGSQYRLFSLYFANLRYKKLAKLEDMVSPKSIDAFATVSVFLLISLHQRGIIKDGAPVETEVVTYELRSTTAKN